MVGSGHNQQNYCYTNGNHLGTAPFGLFENLPELLRPSAVSNLLGVSLGTIYDWKYRGKTRRVPGDLFLKLNRSLYIRTEVLRNWIISNN